MCVICVSWGQRREIEEDNIDIDMTNHASIQVSEQGSETLNKELGKIRFELNEKREKSKRKLLERNLGRNGAGDLLRVNGAAQLDNPCSHFGPTLT